MPPWYVRLWCWLIDHRWVGEQRAAPVIPLFLVCGRCGHWCRLLDRPVPWWRRLFRRFPKLTPGSVPGENADQGERR